MDKEREEFLARVRELFSYDEEAGVFIWRVRRGRGKAGSVAGNLNQTGYVFIKIDGRQYKAHRLAWLYVHGEWPRRYIDHINGNRADNRIANLRDVSMSGNNENLRGPRRVNKLGVLGVYLSQDGSYIAKITRGGKRRYLGSFRTLDEAVSVRRRAEQQFPAAAGA